jgi:hypothetical protein
MPLFLTLIASAVIAQATPDTPSATPSPPIKRTLTLSTPPGWRRTETGRYNQWTSADGTNFRVSASAPSPDLQGPNAIDAVKKMVGSVNSTMMPNSTPDITKVVVCNGTQAAYRVDHLLGANSTAFMMLIPGTVSTGLINYEVHPGQTPDPAMLQAIDKICWP